MTKAAARPDELRRQIEMVPLRGLRPSDRNARTHSKKQIAQIAASIVRFGPINPLIIDANGRVVAGHARLEAAKSLGLKTLPAIRVTNLSDTELRAYMLADNKLALNAGWDREILAVELQELEAALPDIGLDIEITGFDPGEVDGIMSDFASPEANPADEIPEVQSATTSRRGDLYLLGKHRLTVDDARDRAAYSRLMGSELAEMAFLDPPYNVPVQGHVGGRGAIKYRDFAFASGEMTSNQFTQFLKDTLGNCASSMIDGAISYVCIDWRHMRELLEAGAAAYDELKNVCVWRKTNAGQGSFYRSQHELVFVYKSGKAAHLNTFELGQHGRSRSNVWTYAGANTFRAGRMDDLKAHPTVKPAALVADALRDCSRRGSIVLDSFAGAGTTILAAEQVGRRAYCMEIDPQYVDVAIRRWQKITAKDAILESTGQTFDETSAIRSDPIASKKSRGMVTRPRKVRNG